MVTKGIIKSIDLLGNTCTVHIPFFETAGNDPIIETATVSNTPGSYNGYKVGDAVYVAFEDGNMSTPVIIGKLYLGTEKEKADPRGVSNVEESSAAKKATLPADSKLAVDLEPNVPNTTVPYSSLSSIANGLNTLNTEVGQMDRDYGNRFKQVFSDINGFESKIEQSAANMVAKVSGPKFKRNPDGSIEYGDDGKPVIEGGNETEAFGWELQNTFWSAFYTTTEDDTQKVTEILKADKNGLKVTGEIIAEKGHLGKFIIGEEHTHKDADGKVIVESGLYTEDYIDCFKQKPGEDPRFDGETSGEIGVYIGTGGIKLGTKFSIDPNGSLSAGKGYIGKFIIGEEHTHKDAYGKEILDEKGNPIIESGIYSENYIKCFYDDVEKGQKGVYIGTNGIKLGENFSIDTSGNLTAKEGHIGNFEIGAEHPCIELPGNYASGIYSTGYITQYETTVQKNQKGVYIGTDGIKLGDKFSVDVNGNLTASALTTLTGTVTEMNEDLADKFTAINNKFTETTKHINSTTAIAQDKSTNYYSDTNPSKDYTIKEGDCWFDTGERTLKQCADATEGTVTWIDIGEEIVANKNITAKKIEILDNNSGKALFKADGINNTPIVQIAGFEVSSNSITSREKIGQTLDGGADKPGVYIGTDGISIGTGFKVTASGESYISNVQLTNEQKEELKGEQGEKGDTGATGRSVLSTTKYYKLSSSTPAAPTTKEPADTDWSTSPPTFIAGNNYYESVCTIYDTIVEGKDFEWSTPVQNSMLTVEFINSLGITAEKAEKIDIQTENGDSIFVADGLTIDGVKTPEVKIGGWVVEEDKSELVRGWVFRMADTDVVSGNYTLKDFKWESSNGLTTADPTSVELTEVYLFYYMCSRGFRFRMCNEQDFDKIKKVTITDSTYYYDFDILQLRCVSMGSDDSGTEIA